MPIKYRAYAGEKEITNFYIGEKETKQIWAGNTLIWEKSGLIQTSVFEFEWKDKIKFAIDTPGVGKIKIRNSYGYSEIFDIDTATREFSFFKTGIHKTKIMFQSNIRFRMILVHQEIPNGDPNNPKFESSIVRILSSIPRNLFQIITNYHGPLWESDFRFSGPNTTCPYFCEVPENLFENHKDVSHLDYAFLNCTQFTKIPPRLLEGLNNLSSISNIFSGCSITEIPPGLFGTCPNITIAIHAFSNTNITNIPSSLFASFKYNCVLSFAFAKTKITNVPPGLIDFIYNSTIVNGSYRFSGLFMNCIDLTHVDENFMIPLKNRSNVLIEGIFYGCSNLRMAPKLWTLTENGYIKWPDTNFCGGAYFGCVSLPWYNEIPELLKKDISL